MTTSNPIIDLQIFDKQCQTLSDPPFDIIPVRNLKWRQGDMETLGVIAHDYYLHIDYTLTELKQKNMLKGSALIQAGGNCGLYPALLTKFFSPVFTFEPDPVNFHCLVNNCQFPNVIKFNAAVGSRNGKIKTVQTKETNFGMTKIEEVDTNDYIPMVMIDNFEFDDISMIQLDVEGYENEVLDGAYKTIENNRPVIMVETINPKQITKFLEPFGYGLYKKLRNNLDYIYVPKERL